MAAARASSPEVGSSINIIEGFATSSTAIVKRFLCSVDKPELPGIPTKAFLRESSSTNLSTSSTKSWSGYKWDNFRLWLTKQAWDYKYESLTSEDEDLFLFLVYFLWKAQKGRKHKGLINGHLWRMYVILFNISWYSCKGTLLLWVTRYSNVSFYISARLSSSKDIHQCRLSCSTWTN